MNRDDIIRMAREAGDDWDSTLPQDKAFLERFAVLIAAAEREACAKVCEEIKGVKLQGYEFAAAIRARENK